MKHAGCALLILLIAVTDLLGAPKAVDIHLSWTIDQKTESYTHDQTGFSFRPSAAGFSREKANPVTPNGEASFSYFGKRGVISVWLAHRVVEGFPGKADCIPAMRDAHLQTMRETHGQYDAQGSVRLSCNSKGKHGKGSGVWLHFLKSKDFKTPVYSEFGAILVDEFVYFYRATFNDMRGLNDLSKFLASMGITRN